VARGCNTVLSVVLLFLLQHLIELMLMSSALPVRHLPSWTPGAKFLGQADVWKKEADTMFDEPFDLFVQQMVSGDKIGAG